MRHKPCIGQKIVGGGTPSAIATCRAFDLAQQGKLPLIVLESALYQSGDFNKSQETALGQGTFTINSYSTEHFTEQRLRRMVFALKYYGLQQKCILVVRSGMLQNLDRELQKSCTQTERNTAIEMVRQFLDLIKEKGVVIFGGVDHVLRTKKPEVYTPLASKGRSEALWGLLKK